MHHTGPTRQKGRYNRSKDERKNQHKPNRKTNADEIEDKNDIRDSCAPSDVIVGNVAAPVVVSVLPSDPVTDVPISPKKKTLDDIKEQGFAPSRSYLKKSDDTK